MKKYIKPEMDLARFECEDIMTLSSADMVQKKEEKGSTGVEIVNVANTSVTPTVNPFN